jgi:hypothetical protein
VLFGCTALIVGRKGIARPGMWMGRGWPGPGTLDMTLHKISSLRPGLVSERVGDVRLTRPINSPEPRWCGDRYAAFFWHHAGFRLHSSKATVSGNESYLGTIYFSPYWTTEAGEESHLL